MVGIRVDVNNIIATGHITRTITVAEEIIRKGGDCIFISADENIIPYVEKKGFKYVVLGSKWDELESETDKLKQVIDRYGIDRLLVDSYNITEKYFDLISKFVKITYFDELYYKGFFRCENLINGLVTPPDYAGYTGRVFKGPAYVPLRKEFQGTGKKEISKEVKRVFLSSGGSDNYNFLCNFLKEFLLYAPAKEFRVEVAVGSQYPHLENLKCYEDSDRIGIHINTDRMKELISSADLAVIAGGMTTYEVCACGTPGIVFSMADNQIEQCKAFDMLGMLRYVGDLREGPDVINKKIFKEMEDLFEQEKRMDISGKMQNIVDGKGASRIADILMGNIEKLS